jgi:hypothetical protein
MVSDERYINEIGAVVFKRLGINVLINSMLLARARDQVRLSVECTHALPGISPASNSS